MSIKTQIERLESNIGTIKEKMVDLELDDGSGKFDEFTAEISGIVDRETPEAEIQQGEVYTLQAGYYHGGTVTAVGGSPETELEPLRTVTPTKEVQNIEPSWKDPDDESKGKYYGLSAVKVEMIPAQFQDISNTTAEAGDVVAGKKFIGADGAEVTGTMPEIEAEEITLDIATQETTIAAGKHDGTGKVKIVPQQVTVTPTEEPQTVDAPSGKVIGKVVVEAIPENYGDVTDADAVAGDLLAGKKAVTNVDGVATEITGTMANNGELALEIDGLNSMSVAIPAGYTAGGTVTLTDDIEERLAAL